MDTNFVDIDTVNHHQIIEDEHDVIILDDDDFMQTTFNLLSNTPLSQKNILDSNPSSFQQTTSSNDPFQFDNQNQLKQNSILIDLTCDDFELNDLLSMHSNSNHQINNNSNPICFDNENNQRIEENNYESPKIKNEVDLKIFNFNFGSSSIEEVLINDDEEDDDQDIIDLKIGHLKKSHQQNFNMPSNITTDVQQQPVSFVMYRTNTTDSSSDTSSIKQSSRSKSAPYKCSHCFKTFNKSYNYKRHIFLHESKSFNSNCNLAHHSGFSINTCPNCKRRILDKSNFNKHLKICNQKTLKNKTFKHSLQVNLENTNSEDEKALNSCNNPKKITILKQHQQQQHHICEICNKEFNKKFNYHRHIRMHYLNEIMNHQHDPKITRSINQENNIFLYNQIDLKFYQCDICMRKFNEQKQLATHKLKWHLTEYDCKYCQIKLNDKFEYLKHLNSTHKENVLFKFECHICKKSFKFMSQYIDHRRSHLIHNYNSSNKNEEDVEMASNGNNDQETSDEVLVDKESLKVCEYCGKRFAKNFNLKRHISTRHTSKNLILNNEKNEILVKNCNHNNSLLFTNSDRLDLIEKNDSNFSNQENSYLSTSLDNFDNDRMIAKIDSRNIFDCNLSQKQFYENCKINHHFNKVKL